MESPGRAVPVAVAIGSNLGDRRAHIEFACLRLSRLLGDLRCSRVIETAPVDAPGPQPAYLNAAATGIWAGSAAALLAALQAIERDRGRVRSVRHAARTLDLDLILTGAVVVNEPGLTVPHPRFRERRFVLEPLAEIAGPWVDPVSGLSISALLARLPRPA